MNTTHLTAGEIIHRLLFRALIEMRHQGHEEKNQIVFFLADLFHNVVPELEKVATGQSSYEDVLQVLKQRATDKGIEKWLNHNLADPQL